MWYYDDCFYYKYIAKPFIDIFRQPVFIFNQTICTLLHLKNYEVKFGKRWHQKYTLKK